MESGDECRVSSSNPRQPHIMWVWRDIPWSWKCPYGHRWNRSNQI